MVGFRSRFWGVRNARGILVRFFQERLSRFGALPAFALGNARCYGAGIATEAIEAGK